MSSIVMPNARITTAELTARVLAMSPSEYSLLNAAYQAEQAAQQAEADAFNAAFEFLSTIKNDAEPGTFRHKVIELMNRKDSDNDELTFFGGIMASEAEGGCYYSTVLKMAEGFADLFFEHYPTADGEGWNREQIAMVYGIFEAWRVKAKAAEMW
jgi:hypothetical protein